MFDIGFTELIVIGVVALIVIGPERLPKVARTAGHLYGRMQRYVSTVKTDISNEIHLEELRRTGQDIKDSVESVGTDVKQQATVVDDFLRSETATVSEAMKDLSAPEEERHVPRPAMKRSEAEQTMPQQSLPLDEPDQNEVSRVPSAVVETARSESSGKPA